MEKRTIKDQITEALLKGVSEQDLITRGYNSGTVRVVAFDLEKQGLRWRKNVRIYNKRR